MSDPWLVYPTQQAATAAIANIDKKWGYPIHGHNAHTGNVDPLAQQTVTWAEASQRATDQKWVFPAPDASHYPLGNPVEEPYDPAWFPPPSRP